MTNIIIHRGTKEIGGSCIEIASNGQRLILDLGFPLMEPGGGELDESKTKNPTVENGILPPVKGLYQDDAPGIIAVIFSHPHLDHYGLADFIHPDIPIYIGRDAAKVIEVGEIFWPDHMKKGGFLSRVKYFEYWKEFEIDSFKIKPFLMDHSAFGASSLLVEVEGKQIFYSGDYRAHGRKAKVFEKLVKDPPSPIHCLITEGTTIGSSTHNGCKSETQVEEELEKEFAQTQGISFIATAASNIDRLVSIYRATKKAGKTLIIDLYQLHLLKSLKVFSPGLPPHEDDHIRVLYIKNHSQALANNVGVNILYRYKKYKIEQDEIIANAGNMVLRLPLSRMKWIAEILGEKKAVQGRFIYSMWEGYLERDQSFNEFSTTFGLPMKIIHTSGHAYPDDVKRLMTALKPKSIIPVHTLSGNQFSAFHKNIALLENGEVFEVPSLSDEEVEELNQLFSQEILAIN